MKKLLVVGGVLLALTVGITGCSATTKKAANNSVPATTSVPVTTAVPVATTAQATATTVAAPPAPVSGNMTSDKGWNLSTFQSSTDFEGDFQATSRITNKTGASATGIFKVTVFNGSTLVGSVQGSASAVSNGQTVTVDMISQDKVSPFTRYEFQVDGSF